MIKSSLPKLGVNIDHIATLRQLRRTPYPDLIHTAKLVEQAGADQITVHLREDKRHIQPEDVKQLRAHLKILLNLEMAFSDEMVKFALKVRPDWVCFVPEKRQELTTEGGLDLSKNSKMMAQAISRLKSSNIKTSCFIEPTIKSIHEARKLGADAVELHTGRFCLATQKGFGKKSQAVSKLELGRIKNSAQLAQSLGLGAHAGHGFDYVNVREVAALELIEEFNIGHSIVCRAALVGLPRAVREMVSAICAP